MATTSAVSYSAPSATSVAGENASETSADATSASSFEQALFELLQANLVGQSALENRLEGFDLPVGGEELPSSDLFAQLLPGEQGDEHLQGIYELLSERLEGDESLPFDEGALKEILASLKELRTSVEAGDLTPEQAALQLSAKLVEEGYDITDDLAESGQFDLLKRLVSAPTQGLSGDPESPAEGVSISAVATSSSDATDAENVEVLDQEVLADEMAAGQDKELANSQRAPSTVTEDFEPAIDRASAQTQTEALETAADQATRDDNVAFSQQTVTQQSAVSQQSTTPTVNQGGVADSSRLAAAPDARADGRVCAAESALQSNQSVSAQSQQAANENGQHEQRQPGRDQQFRDALLGQRIENSAKESESSKSLSFAQAFGLSGQNSSEPVSRLNASMSGFQQLQQAYSTSAQGQLVLNSGAQFGATNWTANISQRVTWMANQQVSHAEIRLDPPDLGSLNIRLSVQNDQASVQFVSPNAQVRDALEQQMPRLREMLEEAGIQLDNSDVSDHASSERQSDQSNESLVNSGLLDADEEEVAMTNVVTQSGELNLVDYYA